MSQDVKYLIFNFVVFVTSLTLLRTVDVLLVNWAAPTLAVASGGLAILNVGAIWNEVRGVEPETPEQSYAAKMRMEKFFARYIGGPALVWVVIAAIWLLVT